MEFLGDLDVPWWGFPVGIGLIVLGLWTMWKAVPFTGKSRDWITTQATVVKVRQKKNREGDGYDKLVRYRFLDQAGNEHQGSEQRFLWGKRGDTFRVKYDPLDPDQHFAVRQHWILLGVGTYLVGAGVVLLLLSQKQLSG
ncbi:MAG: DUF3592 domain-containing protein [Nocardioides sp.]|jgi:hypothetical protein